jgi:hypothetical protein
MSDQLIRVQYHDAGIRLSYPTGSKLRIVDMPVDEAVPLAHAMLRVADDVQTVDEATKSFKVQWYDDGVLVSYQHGGDWSRFHLSMPGARIVADAILVCVDKRDVIVCHDADIAELPETDEPQR